MRKILLGAVGLLGFLVVWQLIPTLGLVDPHYLPYATDVFGRLAEEVRDLAFWRRIRLTMTSWAIGLTVATLAAVALGTVVGLVPFLRRATHTTVEFLRPVPSVALIPLAVLMFGLQMRAALVIIVYAAFWQVFVQVIYGVADVDTVARDTARSFGLTRAERLRYLVLPTALPYLMTGLRLGAAVALILAVTAEMVIGNPGLGRMIELSRSAGDAVGLYGLVVVTGVLGLLVNLVFRFVERRSLAWHQSVLADEAAR
ncbi:ABC transporter permease [Micromonospora sp. B006]|uniref:ABC transporter permease n=1 Tax=Micromonospora sp. B006 TaxID=2201999 RepID=UPI000E30184B|nr:ABC transporter permease [Micromonospora sp. B006]AXO35259.1 alkanesulfonates transport system permease protein [Micromonospora sp. B006]